MIFKTVLASCSIRMLIYFYYHYNSPTSIVMLVLLNTVGSLTSLQLITAPLSAVVKLEIMRFDSGMKPASSVVEKRPDDRDTKLLAGASIISPSPFKPNMNQLYTVFLPVHVKVADSPSQRLPLTVLVKVRPV